MSEVETKQFQSVDVGKLVAALAKAKLGYGEVSKSKKNTYTGSLYADLQDLMTAAERPLAENELVVVHFPVERIADKKAGAVTKLIHSSGQYFANEFLMPATGKASGGAEKLDAQTVTGAVTYAKRCNYGALVGLVGEDDDDGNILADQSTENAKPVASPKAPKAPPVSQAKANQGAEPRPSAPKTSGEAVKPPASAPAPPQTSEPKPVAPAASPKPAVSASVETPVSSEKSAESTTSKPPEEVKKPEAGSPKPDKSQFDTFVARVRDEIKPALEKAGLKPSRGVQTGAKLKNFILFQFGAEAKELNDLTLSQWNILLEYFKNTPAADAVAKIGGEAPNVSQ